MEQKQDKQKPISNTPLYVYHRLALYTLAAGFLIVGGCVLLKILVFPDLNWEAIGLAVTIPCMGITAVCIDKMWHQMEALVEIIEGWKEFAGELASREQQL